MLFIPSTHTLDSRPLTLSRRRRPRSLRESVNSRTFSGRADNACTNLLGFFVRYVRTRGMVEIAGSGKTADFIICYLPHTLATHGSRDKLVHAAVVCKEDGASPPC